MLEKEQLERLQVCFPNYSSAMSEADFFFYRTFDPVHFVRLAAQFKLPPYVSEATGEGKDLIPDNAELFDHTRQSFFRFLRYLSSETLVLLVLSGYPLGPAPRLMEKLRGSKLNRVFSTLAAGSVPSGYELFRDGEELKSADWINVLAFSGMVEDEEYCRKIVDFVKGECGLLENRDAINAFKHGRIQKSVKGQAFQMHFDDSAEKRPLLKGMKGAIHWLGWTDKSDETEIAHTLKLGFEEVDDETDYRIILATGALMTAIAEIRRGRIDGETSFNVLLPDLEVGCQLNQRMEFNSTTTWPLKRGEL
ncbi:hypothetical protein [Nioella sp.]|uniref:hypothetical protein n=1 Tax=Nioella sp. TaxID=1912091 RepID=UPI003A8B4D9B